VRHILHADLDAFYAAVEQLDRPDLRWKPVIVGARPEDRGVVATASYEARAYGVHSAMPMSVAVRLCPNGIIVRPRLDRYREMSGQVMKIFLDLTDLVEPLSLDEAYLDITAVVESGVAPLAVALDLKRQVNVETGLTLSVGVATSKAVAKIASDLNKPDGLVVVQPGDESRFLDPLPVGKQFGIGPKTLALLHDFGIDTIGQLAQQPMDWMIRRFGKRGVSIHTRALGKDEEPIQTERAIKSISAETTFVTDLSDPNRLYAEMASLARNLARRMGKQNIYGKTVVVKLRLADFTTFTRQITLPMVTRSESIILENSWRLLSHELSPGLALRLLGVGMSTLGEATQLQLHLIEEGTTSVNSEMD
jgi:DNA polymerase-4